MYSAHSVEPEEVMAYLDGELPVERGVAVAEHVKSCPECQSIAADLQGVSRRLQAWTVEAPSGAAPRRTRSPWVRRAAWCGGLVAAGLALMAVVTPSYRSTEHWADMARTRPAAALVAQEPAVARTGSGTMIVRTASIALTSNRFDGVQAAVEELLSRRAGRVGELSTTRRPAAGRTLEATLRIPSDQLDQTLEELRRLGRVESESQGGTEVSRQAMDLDARLRNSRAAEQRLAQLLRARTGNITDVLEVEKEMTRVREEIERMDAERKSLGERVAYAAVDLKVTEEYRAATSPQSFSGAAAEGWSLLLAGLMAVALFLLSYGPSMLIWAGILYIPARFLWRRFRPTQYRR
jgi:hypothetical protein